VHAPTLIGVGERIDEGGPRHDVSTHVAAVARLLERAGVATWWWSASATAEP
jgi:hypothetical protein